MLFAYTKLSKGVRSFSRLKLEEIEKMKKKCPQVKLEGV